MTDITKQNDFIVKFLEERLSWNETDINSYNTLMVDFSKKHNIDNLYICELDTCLDHILIALDNLIEYCDFNVDELFNDKLIIYLITNYANILINLNNIDKLCNSNIIEKYYIIMKKIDYLFNHKNKELK